MSMISLLDREELVPDELLNPLDYGMEEREALLVLAAEERS